MTHGYRYTRNDQQQMQYKVEKHAVGSIYQMPLLQVNIVQIMPQKINECDVILTSAHQVTEMCILCACTCLMVIMKSHSCEQKPFTLFVSYCWHQIYIKTPSKIWYNPPPPSPTPKHTDLFPFSKYLEDTNY